MRPSIINFMRDNSLWGIRHKVWWQGQNGLNRVNGFKVLLLFFYVSKATLSLVFWHTM